MSLKVIVAAAALWAVRVLSANKAQNPIIECNGTEFMVLARYRSESDRVYTFTYSNDFSASRLPCDD